jgi:hypothetical protein
VLNRQHLHHALELAQYNLPGGSRRGEKPSRYLVSDLRRDAFEMVMLT